MPYWRSIDAPVPVQPITPLRFEDVRHVAAFLEPGLAISILKYYLRCLHLYQVYPNFRLKIPVSYCGGG